MAKNQTTRINGDTLQADKDSFAAAKAIQNYQPANAAFSIQNVQTASDEVQAAQQAWAQAVAALEAARDAAVAKEWAFHNAVLGLKSQVVAQFGQDSNEVQAVGLKKKSEYKSRARNGKTAPANS